MGFRFNIGSSNSVNGSKNKILTVIALLSGLAVAVYGGMDYIEQSNRLSNAETVNATVIETSIDEETSSSRRGGTSREYKPVVSFEYIYEGENYTSANFYPTDSKFSKNSREAAEEIIERYPEEEQIQVYLDPDSPGEAFLREEKSNRPLLLIGFGTLMALMGARSLIKG